MLNQNCIGKEVVIFVYVGRYIVLTFLLLLKNCCKLGDSHTLWIELDNEMDLKSSMPMGI